MIQILAAVVGCFVAIAVFDGVALLLPASANAYDVTVVRTPSGGEGPLTALLLVASAALGATLCVRAAWRISTRRS